MTQVNQTALRQDIERLRAKADRLKRDAQDLAKKGKTAQAQDAQAQAQNHIEQADRLEQDYNQTLEFSQLFKRQADVKFNTKRASRDV